MDQSRNLSSNSYTRIYIVSGSHLEFSACYLLVTGSIPKRISAVLHYEALVPDVKIACQALEYYEYIQFAGVSSHCRVPIPVVGFMRNALHAAV